MKEKFNELFNGELEVKKDGKSIAAVGDKEYWLFEIDDALTCEDGRQMKRAIYIANAVNNFADMYEMLESKLDLIRCGIGANYSGDPKQNPKYLEVVELLKRARGE